MNTQKLTLNNTNKRIDVLEQKLNKILNLLEESDSTKEAKPKKFFINIETMEHSNKGIVNQVKFLSTEFTDENDNFFVQLPKIWVNIKENPIIKVSLFPQDGYMELTPQAISKYKNSWIDGKVRSIPNVAPDLNQFSYLKSLKLCKWANGEMLNWKTVLYIQLVWLCEYGTIQNNDILPNEKYNWSSERDCAFGDTGKGIGEFLGIEQLFTSGRNLVDLSNPETELWGLYKEWNFDKDFNPNEKFALWCDYNPDEESEAGFFSDWYGDVRYASWYGDDVALRLCKKPYSF
ncbi:hypothetical protein [Mammaliicoccus vitulinus]|uniref:hypothetical protein n=1 Tax=Mammaliicoccus vitulinus TaxID=71237 RepID=UPI00248BDECB|nr:hypothetical protein [Mammaliicoccus vitulinus]